MKALSEFIKKRIVIIFNDGESVKRKEGILISASSDGILFDENGKEIYIPDHRIVKVERASK